MAFAIGAVLGLGGFVMAGVGNTDNQIKCAKKAHSFCL